MAPRAGPSRSQRTQRVSGPSQSQSQRPSRRRNHVEVADGEDEDDEDAGDDEENMEMHFESTHVRKGGDGSSDVDLDRKASDLVRLALFTEHKRVPLRREDISKKVLGSNPRSFNAVYEKAQKLLRKTFAMELVELQSRSYREQDNVAVTDLQEARNATGVKKKVAAAGSKTYILRSTLDPVIIEHAALTDDLIYNAEQDDVGDVEDDEIAVRYGSIISWSTADQLGALGVLHVVLALVLVNGRSMNDMDLRGNLKRLRLPQSGTVEMSSQSTHKCLPVDTYLSQLVRQGYLDHIRLDDNRGPVGGKRGRAPVTTQASMEEGTWEWRWGNRAHSEIGEKAVANFVAEFMVERTRGDDDEDDEDENAGPARGRGRDRGGNDSAEKKLIAMLKGVERAAGGSLAEIK